MLQRALIKFRKIVFYKKLLQKWLDNVYSCTQKVSSKVNMDLNVLLWAYK